MPTEQQLEKWMVVRAGPGCEAFVRRLDFVHLAEDLPAVSPASLAF